MPTEFRPLPGFEDLYAISEYGVIIRTGKPKKGGPDKRDFALSNRPNGQGYLLCSVLDKSGKGRTVFVSKAVCIAWHGPPPSPQHQAAHLDGSRTNNHYSNLAWKTREENAADKKATRHTSAGEGFDRTRPQAARAQCQR